MIKKHGNKQIEFSNYFDIKSDKRSEIYDIEILFNIPKSLNNGGYSPEAFFNEITTYTRYNAPYISLEQLADLNYPLNPLARLLKIDPRTENLEEIEYELKTLVNTFKFQCKKITKSNLFYNKTKDWDEIIKRRIVSFNSVLENLVHLSIKAPNELKKIYNMAIEGISIRIEKTLYRIYLMDKLFEDIALEEIIRQREFRESRGYMSITKADENSNSKFIYKEHLLKKWAESIMYINMEDSKTQRGLSHIFLGSAAALAMLVAGSITLIFRNLIGSDGLYFFIGAMLIYSIKDRFKDIFKSIFIKRVSLVFADRVKTVISPINRRKCGRSMEKVTFPRKSDDPTQDIIVDLIHYKKHVKISTKKLYKNHSRLFGIKEIIRFDLRKIFYKMDRDVEKCYIPKDGSLVEVKGDREYIIDLEVKVKTSSNVINKKYQVIANSKRIKRVVSLT